MDNVSSSVSTDRVKQQGKDNTRLYLIRRNWMVLN